MAGNLDMTYCNGRGCRLSAGCLRYLEGQRIILNREGDTAQHRFVDSCDPETREMYSPADVKEDIQKC